MNTATSLRPAAFLTFHIEHIESWQHVVDDSPDDLALACPDCNFHNRPNLVTLDAVTREIVRLFDPQRMPGQTILNTAVQFWWVKVL